MATSKGLRGSAGSGPAGYIFCCSNATQMECLDRLLLGSPRADWQHISLLGHEAVLFLWNFESRRLNGVFRPSSAPALDIVRNAWASSGRQYPAQIRVKVEGTGVKALSKAQLEGTGVCARSGPLSADGVKQLLRLFGVPVAAAPAPAAVAAAAGGGAMAVREGADKKRPAATYYEVDYMAMLETFKVKPCARRNQHAGGEQAAWRRCPFAVDPSTRQLIKDGSRFAYNTARKLPSHEFLYHPEQYKTKPCEEFARTGRCGKGAICAFRHLHDGVDYDAAYTSANAHFPWAPRGNAAAVAAGAAAIAAVRASAQASAAATARANAAAVQRQAEVRRKTEAKKAAELQSIADAKRAKRVADAKALADRKEAAQALRMEEGRKAAAARRAKKEAATTQGQRDAQHKERKKHEAAPANAWLAVQDSNAAGTAGANHALARQKQMAVTARNVQRLQQLRRQEATAEAQVPVGAPPRKRSKPAKPPGYQGSVDVKGEPHGHGVYRWGNGDSYDGEWKLGKKDGEGTLTGKDFGTFTGQWRNGKEHGRGLHVYPDGCRFEGTFKDGKRWEGKGTFVIGGDKFEGEMEAGKLHGHGVFRWGNYCYDGEWKLGKEDGEGTLTIKGCSTFTGQWRDGKKHGHGVVTSTKKGEEGFVLYVGQFVRDKKQGQGIKAFKEPFSRYEGNFKDDLFHGHGVQEISRDGHSPDHYEGQFCNGHRCGSGTYTFGDSGGVYTGQWADSKMNGRGILRVDGSVYDGDFTDGYKHGQVHHTIIAAHAPTHTGTLTFLPSDPTRACPGSVDLRGWQHVPRIVQRWRREWSRDLYVRSGRDDVER